jgi:hypothetical protein
MEYQSYSNTEASKEIAWINHYSWLNNEIGKRKVDYQKKNILDIARLNGMKKKA